MNKVVFNKLEELGYGQKEAISTLKANLQFSDSSNKTLLFTSPTSEEGKSSVALLYAKLEADSGSNTVFVDANFRKSVFQEKLKIQPESKPIKGLYHCLFEQSNLDDVTYNTNFQNLDIILSAHISLDSIGLFNGNLLKNLIDSLNKKYDKIIIDAPSLGTVIDAAIIASSCDGAILVIESNQTSYKDAVGAKKQLERSGCEMLGVVLNK